MRTAALALSVLLFATLVRGADRARTPPDKPSLFFITDYLPHAVYERDSLVACFRVENTGPAEAPLEFYFGVVDGDRLLNETVRRLTVGAGKFGSAEGALDAKPGIRLRFGFRRAGQVLWSVTLRLLGDTEAWPQTLWRDGRLIIKDPGELLVPCVSRRAGERERGFLPLKWIVAQKAPEGTPAPPTLTAFVPARWGLPEDPAFRAYAPPERNLAPSLLSAVDQFVRTWPPPPAQGEAERRLVLCLPPEDLELGTDLRVFRILVDTLLCRAAALPRTRVSVVPPFHYGVPEKRQQAYWKEVLESAAIYKGGALDPAEFLDEALWRFDPDIKGVYGRRPNAIGLKKIAQGLMNIP